MYPIPNPNQLGGHIQNWLVCLQGEPGCPVTASVAPGQLASLLFLPLALTGSGISCWDDLSLTPMPAPSHVEGVSLPTVYWRAAATSLSACSFSQHLVTWVLRSRTGMQYACCDPCSIQELLIPLSDPVKLHGQVRNGSSLYQKGEIAAREQLADWVIGWLRLKQNEEIRPWRQAAREESLARTHLWGFDHNTSAKKTLKTFI